MTQPSSSGTFSNGPLRPRSPSRSPRMCVKRCLEPSILWVASFERDENFFLKSLSLWLLGKFVSLTPQTPPRAERRTSAASRFFTNQPRFLEKHKFVSQPARGVWQWLGNELS